MAGLGNIATTAIITKGLTGCGHGPVDACRTGLITSPFSLYCITVPTPPTDAATGGGSYPHDAWNKFNPGDIQNFYQPVPPEQQYYVVPRDQEERYFRRHKIIKMKIQMGDIVVEKEYSVPESRAKMTVKALEVVDNTYKNMNVAVSNIKRLWTEAVVTVKNIRLKK